MIVSCQNKETKSDKIAESSTSQIIENKSPDAKVEKPKWTEEEIRIHQEKIEVGEEKLRMAFNSQIEIYTEGKKKAEKELEQIKLFEIGRSQETRDKQLTEQFKLINICNETLSSLKKGYVEIPLHMTFDFQKNPKGVIEHIFFGFKIKNFEKFRHLYDPYVEGDEEMLWLCNIQSVPTFHKESFYESFHNPRIMGEPKIDGNKAIIEIAMGPSSDKLEKIELVKRLDNWYLSSI